MTALRVINNDNDGSQYPWLALPHDLGIPEESINSELKFLTVSFEISCSCIIGHPHLHRWRQMGRRYQQRWIGSDSESTDDYVYPRPKGSCNVQVVRSVSDWSHGVLTEHSIQNACRSIIVKLRSADP